MSVTTPAHQRPTGLETFYFGVPYYPEHWGHDPDHDVRRIAEAGMNMVRLAEFAWAVIEPEQGRYDFDLFDRTLDVCERRGVKVMLCTPTATPPRWMTHAHPDMLRVDAKGRRLEHGSRQHASHMHEGFREHSRRITRVMAERWRDHPAVVAWQTDNEFHCHFSEDHSEAARRAFVGWCRDRYGNLDALNRAWGTIFWSGTYTDWDQLVTPKADAPTHLNPAHVLDYNRFLSDAVRLFQREQVEILREVNPAWWVTHNGEFGHIDYRKFRADLDLLSWDGYPMFYPDPADRPGVHAYHLDRVRGWGGNFFIPEQQGGAGGQPPYMLDAPAPGEQRQCAWRSVARGADGVLFFRWRSCLVGAEQYWLGLIDHDDVGRRRFEEAKAFGREARELQDLLLPHGVHVEVGVAGSDQEVEDGFDACTLGLPKPKRQAEAVYRHYFDAGVAVGVVHPGDVLDGLKVLVVPHWPMWHDDWTGPLAEWVEGGGHLVVGALTATRDWQNNMRTATPPGPLAGVGGVCGVRVGESMRVNHVDALGGPARPIRLTTDAGDALGEHWCEWLEVDDAEVTATWRGGWYDGKPAATTRAVGRGRATYVGSWLTPAVMRLVLPEVDPLVPGLPAGVEAVRRGPVTFLLNGGESAVTVNVPGTDRLSGRAGDGLTLEPFGVAAMVSG